MPVDDSDIRVIHDRIEKYSERFREHEKENESKFTALEREQQGLRTEIALSRKDLKNLETNLSKDVKTILERIGDSAANKKETWMTFLKSFLLPIATAVIVGLIMLKAKGG